MAVLSEKSIKALTPPEKGRKKVVYDDHRDAPRGFGIRITPNGTRSFVLRYSAGGRDRLLAIGEHGSNKWSLDAARKRAGEYRREIDGGVDILEQRRAERKEPTVAEVVEDFCRAHADKLKSGPATRSALERYLVGDLGKVKLKAVRRRDVIAVVEKVAEAHPRQAALLLGYIKLLFAWCEDRELIDANPAATLRPQKIDRRLAPRKRARVLDDDEIRTLWTQAETVGLHRVTALALKLILVTGQRPGEVAGLRWSEVDGDVWVIPAERRGKTETAHAVPLTATALRILEAARAEVERLNRRRRRKAGNIVFEARPGLAVSTNALDRAVARYADALENRDVETWGRWRPHDLRRTMRTGLSAAGVDEHIAELAIGHTRKGIAAVYDLHRYDAEKRAALERWERRLLRIVGETPEDDNVVELRR